MSWFYTGAAKIERALDGKRVGKFMDAVAMWWIVLAALFCVAVAAVLIVALVESVVA